MDAKLQLNQGALKRLRQRLGLSQKALAQACEQQRLRISIATLKRAESGKFVSDRTARELARFFEVELDSLLPSPQSNNGYVIGLALLALWVGRRLRQNPGAAGPASLTPKPASV